MEGTRLQVIAQILAWLDSDDANARVFWLNGMAGLGKSTIAKTIAAIVDELGYLGASFFFSRSAESSRRSTALVLPTLAFQLSRQSPSFYAATLKSLEDNAGWAGKAISVQGARFSSIRQESAKPGRPLLIVIDAFDECDDTASTELLRALITTAAASLIGNGLALKLFITSRPETRITAVFENYKDRTGITLHAIEESVVQADIELYLRRSLSQIPIDHGWDLPPSWYQGKDFKALLDRAGQLFIYASTAVRFIESGEPKSQLQALVTADTVGDADYRQVDELYSQILKKMAGQIDQNRIVRQFQLVVGTLLFLRDNLALIDMAKFLGISVDQVRSVLKDLSSVIILPRQVNQPATPYHPSFFDFITSDHRCPQPQFRLNPQTHHHRLAERCLQEMITRLHFNMAGIEDPNQLLSEISSVVKAIPSQLTYACRFWTWHLSRAPPDPRLTKLLEEWLSLYVMHWIEVCVISDSMNQAITGILEAKAWAVSDRYEILASILLTPAAVSLDPHAASIPWTSLTTYTDSSSRTSPL